MIAITALLCKVGGGFGANLLSPAALANLAPNATLKSVRSFTGKAALARQDSDVSPLHCNALRGMGAQRDSVSSNVRHYSKLVISGGCAPANRRGSAARAASYYDTACKSMVE